MEGNGGESRTLIAGGSGADRCDAHGRLIALGGLMLVEIRGLDFGRKKGALIAGSRMAAGGIECMRGVGDG